MHDLPNCPHDRIFIATLEELDCVECSLRVAKEELESLFRDAENALLAIEFFKSGNEDAIMRTIREIVHRGPIDERETKLLKAISLEVVHYLERKGVRS